MNSEFVKFSRKHFGLRQGSFRYLRHKALVSKVEDVADAPGPDRLIDESRPISYAVRQLIVSGEVSLFVTRKGEIVGILTLIDAFDVMAQEIKSCTL